MTFPIRILILCSGLVLVIFIFELVRRQRFREELSLTWFLVGLFIMASAVGDLIVDPVARVFGIGYPPALFFAWVIFCLVVTLLYFSSVISDLKGKIKELSQKIALIEFEMHAEKKDAVDDPPAGERSDNPPADPGKSSGRSP